MNLHFHTLVLDGVFAEALGEALVFHPAPGPTDAEVAAALATIRQRVQRLLVRRGLEPGDDATVPADPLVDESPLLAGIIGASRAICHTSHTREFIWSDRPIPPDLAPEALRRPQDRGTAQESTWESRGKLRIGLGFRGGRRRAPF